MFVFVSFVRSFVWLADDDDVAAAVVVRHLARVFVSGYNHIAHLASVEVALKTHFQLSFSVSRTRSLSRCISVVNICILAALCNYSVEETESECEKKEEDEDDGEKTTHPNTYKIHLTVNILCSNLLSYLPGGERENGILRAIPCTELRLRRHSVYV